VRQQSRTVDAELARLAARAHGVVTRRELLASDVSEAELRSRLERGSLIRVHRGVYRVGHQAPSHEARYLAAVLAGGSGALLRGRAAGWLLGLVRGPPPPAEVVTPTERRIEGVRTVRSRGISSRDAWMWRGVPVKSVARTMVDLASVLSLDALARAFHEAGIRYGTRPDDVMAFRASVSLRRVLCGDVHVT
jgi:predicted transcriptional regulator of viral defense system